MESMDDIEMLLPGLKVSSSLIRQQPLRRGGAREAEQQGIREQDSEASRGKPQAGQKSQSDKAAMKTGSKRRRATETWALDLELCSGDAKRFQAGELSASRGGRRLAPLQTEEASGGALDLMQAGITTSMLDDLIESPRTAPPGHHPLDVSAKPSSPSSSPSRSPSSPAAASSNPASAAVPASAPGDLSASPAPCDRTGEGGAMLVAMGGEAKPLAPAAGAVEALTAYPDALLSSCGLGLKRYLSGIQEEMSPLAYPSSPRDTAADMKQGEYLRGGLGPDDSSDVEPAEYLKSKSAPPRMEAHLASQSHEGPGSAAEVVSREGGAGEGGSRPVPAGSAPGAHASEEGSRLEKRASLSRSPTPGPSSPSAYQKCSLSRTEKWHERISIATLRLKSRSLPCTPDRARSAHSLAAL